MRKNIAYIFLFILLPFVSKGQDLPEKDFEPEKPPFLNVKSQWVDSVFQSMSPDDRIAQLIMIAAYSNKNKAYEDSLSNIIKKHKVGGLIFFQGGPVRQANLTNRYQSESKVPLMIAIDGEWGLGMRLDSIAKFPFQMTLGAISDNQLIYDMGAEIAKHCKRMGVHVNFAPVVDINNNPNNPVINYRSFGEDKYKVTAKGFAYMKGMQDHHILANAKHFPGHGDTDVDSHYALPLISHDRKRMDSLEMYPFKQLFNSGMGSVMVAHLNIPSLDSQTEQASTLSKNIVTDILQKELGFEGLIFTDALNMRGVADYFPPGEVDVRALLAGNDVLLFSKDVGKAISEIKKAIKSGKITQEEIDRKCKKILAAKAWAGLDQYKPVRIEGLVSDLNMPETDLLTRKLVEASATLLRNQNDVVPIKDIKSKKMATLSIHAQGTTDFQSMLQNYAPMDEYYLPKGFSEENAHNILNTLREYDVVFAGVHDLNQRARGNFGLNTHSIHLLSELAKSGKAVIAFFGNPYALAKIPNIDKASALLVTYQEHAHSQQIAAQVIFGGIGASGHLPVNVSANFRLGDGIKTIGGGRFKYTVPEEVHINSFNLQRKIDSLVNQAIQEKATPGCQVFVAKDGKVIFNKAYGYHTYDSLRLVDKNDIYDLASITKIATSVPVLMKLYDEGHIHPDDKLKKHLWKWGFNNKRNLTFRDILTHRAGLKAWIPFWKETVNPSTGLLKDQLYSTTYSEKYTLSVNEKLFLKRDYNKKFIRKIRRSPVKKGNQYVYSDLSYYLYPIILKSKTGHEFTSYLSDNFFGPLGAQNLKFNAYKNFSGSRIIPTEYDSLFRRGLIKGYVHDEGAALFNGISGHAGLFGNAQDLAKLMQMYLNGGEYGGERYINKETIHEFTRYQFYDEGNRRGIGFDKPMIDNDLNGNAAMSASKLSYGHSGFTGTFTWADPENGLVYVFLSNRVYPTRENLKLSKLNTRTRIHQAIYDEILQGEKSNLSKAADE